MIDSKFDINIGFLLMMDLGCKKWWFGVYMFQKCCKNGLSLNPSAI